ncbi:hypothetical protein KI387_033529, partial [Taxus chinensis]
CFSICEADFQKGLKEESVVEGSSLFPAEATHLEDCLEGLWPSLPTLYYEWRRILQFQVCDGQTAVNLDFPNALVVGIQEPAGSHFKNIGGLLSIRFKERSTTHQGMELPHLPMVRGCQRLGIKRTGMRSTWSLSIGSHFPM